MADAGPDQTVPVGLRVSLDGSKSKDVDGDVLKYRWEFVSKPAGSTAVLDGATTATPSFLLDQPGSYTVQLIVNDGQIDSDPDTVVINTQNSKPVANAGPDVIVTVGTTVQLDGSGSSDADLNPLSYLWSFTTRPDASTAELSDPKVLNPTFVADKVGLFIVQLVVNDGKQDSDPDTASITVQVVPTPNQPPVADAGTDQTAKVGDTVHLDGNKSIDPDNDTLSFSWQFVLRPASSTTTLINAGTATPSFVVDVAGPYSVQLTVSDGKGGTATDTVNITATTGTNQPPVANAGSDQTVSVGATVSLNGAGSSDPEGDSLSFQWTITTKPTGSTAILVNANTATPSFVADVVGDYIVELVVNDGKVASLPDTVQVTAAPEAPLAITITAPIERLLTNATQVQVSGTVESAATSVKVNGVVAILSSTTFVAPVPVHEGSNTITAVARDAAGRVGTASVTVIRDTTPPSVVIESPMDGQVVNTPTVTVVGMVNDIVTGTVNQENCQGAVSGPGGIITAAVKNRTFLVADFPLALGANSITAVATDTAKNDSAPFQLQVTRQAPQGPQLQIISGNDQTGEISTTLAAPLVVKASDETGNPLAGKAVRFQVVRNNGLLHTTDSPAGASELTVVTDAAGQALVEWTLGNRVGAGNNRVEVSAAGIAVPALFRASATHAPCDKLLTMSGENQVGVVGSALARPFEVVAVDPGGNVCEDLPVTFEVEEGGGNFGGAPAVTILTNADGRAAAVLTLGPTAGVNNNVVGTSSPDLTGLGAHFRASAVVPGPEAETRFVGVVLDNEDQPIPNAKVQIENTNPLISSFTDANGQFVLNNVPVGSGLLFVDGATTTRPGVWPPLEFQIDVIAGIDNTLGMPIYLPELNSNGFRTVGSEDVILEMAGVEGFKLKIFANSATFPGGSKTGVMGVTQVSNDQVPMPPPGGLAPAWVLTLQPPGVRLNPPAQLTMPNATGLPPGQIIDIFSFDHDLQQFVSVGTATVQPDGAMIVSDPGSGIRKSGWGHGPPPPPPPGRRRACAGTSGPCPPTPPPPQCPSTCDDGNTCNGTETCNAATGTCQPGTPLVAGTPCNDGNSCTIADQCFAGSCQGTPQPDGMSCDDGNAATFNDQCQSGTCHGSPNQCVNGLGQPLPVGSPCDDGNSCTSGDQCFAGSCQGTPQPDGTSCDDGNPATFNDQCQSGTCHGSPNQCVNGLGQPLPAGTPCNDGNSCTIADQCFASSCQGTPAPVGTSCDDGNDCTAQDQCISGNCTGTPVPDGTSCNDGNPATFNDHCQGGTCIGSTGGPCRDSAGNPLPNNGTACSDGDACTAPDVCSSGSCAAGPAVTCADDDNICNGPEFCDSLQGCQSGPPAQDGMACSGGVCISGTCCPSNATVTLKSKAAWQADVNTEVLADSGLDMTQFDPSKPFSGQKGYVQAAYKYYEKRFLEHPDIFLWAGLAKLAGAPVYAGLSDLENGGAITDLSSFTLRLAQLLGVPAGTLGVVAPALLDAFTNLAPQIQRNLMAINRTVFFDIAWQLKAYAAPDGGLCALEYIASVDPEALDISAWRSIDQGLRENNTALIAAGNLELLYREQHDVVQPILGATTSPGRVLTAFTLNPVPNGISFLEWALDLWFVNPTAVFSLPTFDKRWNWINAPDRGMWSLWIQANSSTRRVWVGQPLTGPTGRAQTYALFPDLVE